MVPADHADAACARRTTGWRSRRADVLSSPLIHSPPASLRQSGVSLPRFDTADCHSCEPDRPTHAFELSRSRASAPPQEELAYSMDSRPDGHPSTLTSHKPHRCLLLLDNVDRPSLLDPAMVARLDG